MSLFDNMDGNKKPLDNSKGFLCTHDTIRTCDLRIRSPLLYPAELRALEQLLYLKYSFMTREKLAPVFSL